MRWCVLKGRNQISGVPRIRGQRKEWRKTHRVLVLLFIFVIECKLKLLAIWLLQTWMQYRYLSKTNRLHRRTSKSNYSIHPDGEKLPSQRASERGWESGSEWECMQKFTLLFIQWIWLSGCFQLRAFSPMNNVHTARMLPSNFESLKLFGFNFNLIENGEIAWEWDCYKLRNKSGMFIIEAESYATENYSKI